MWAPISTGKHPSPFPSITAVLLAVFLTGLFLASGRAVDAAPPDNVDTSLGPWFQSLRQPGTGISCCSIADCRLTQYRSHGDGYEAMIDGNWLDVPPDRVLEHISNPTGRAVVCYMPGRGVLCFVRPAET